MIVLVKCKFTSDVSTMTLSITLLRCYSAVFMCWYYLLL